MPPLAPCPDCGRHVLQAESACPHCGAERTPNAGMSRRTVAAAALGLALVGCPGATNSDYGTSSTDTGSTSNADYGTSSTNVSDSDTAAPG